MSVTRKQLIAFKLCDFVVPELEGPLFRRFHHTVQREELGYDYFSHGFLFL